MATKTPPTKGETKKETKASAAKKEAGAKRPDYGYRKGATIVVTDKEQKYSGQRKEWYDSLVAMKGKVVQEWEEKMKGTKNGKGVVQSPRGWLRFYVLDGTIALQGGEEPAPKSAKKEEAAA